MRRFCLTVLAGAVWASGALAQAPDLKNMDVVMRSVPDGPVAKVNGVNIGEDEFMGLYQGELLPMVQLYKSKNQEVPDEIRVETAVRVMGMLVQREILYQEAVRRKLSVADDEVSKGWNSQLTRMKEAFAKIKNQNLSEDDILKMAGTTRGEAMAELKKALLIEKMRDEIAKQKGVTVSDDEINKAYEEQKDKFKQPAGFHLLRIYINTRKHDDAPAMDDSKKTAAKTKMETALKRIQAGESFQTVAKAVSEAPDKEQGGDTGFIPESGLPDSYVKKLATMKPGDISGVFEDELGFHVIKLLESKPGGEVAIDKAKPRIQQVLMAKKTDQAMNGFCQEYLTQKPESVRVFLQLEKTLSTNPEFKKAKEQAASGKDATAPAKPKDTTPKAKKKKSAPTDESAPAPVKTKKAKPKPEADSDVSDSS